MFEIEKNPSFGHEKFNLSKTQKLHFSKGVNPCFWSIFLKLFSVKIRLEIMFNNVLERKETFLGHKKFNIFKSQKIAFFQCHAFGQKKIFFFFICCRSK